MTSLSEKNSYEESTLTVEWIRHGEACTNLFENFAEDEYYDLEKQNNKYNYVAYAEKKEEMKSDEKYKSIIEELDNSEPKKADYGNGNSVIPDDKCFQIKSLFKAYLTKNFFTTDIDVNQIDNLTYNQIELQIDYQKFRRALIKEEEDNYKSNAYSEILNNYITLFKKIYEETYTNKIGNFTPTSKDSITVKDFKDVKDASRMINYTLDGGLNKIDHFKTEEKIDKTNNKSKIFASWFFMPTLSFTGVRQSEYAGENYLYDKIDSYNFIIVSATVRTIMTAAISVYKAFKKHLGVNKPVKQIEINIAPFINEEYNGAALIHSDFANMAIPPDMIINVISSITTWLKTNYSDISNYINITSRKYIDYTSKLDYDTNSNNLEKFLDFVKVGLQFDEDLSILAYTHGNFINERREVNNNNYSDGAVKTQIKTNYKYNKFGPFPNNVSTWIESFNLKENKYHPNYDMTRYDGSYDKQNFGISDKKAFRGSTVRKNLLLTPIEELHNLRNNHFGSLNDNFLRGSIFSMWNISINDENNINLTKYNPLKLFDNPEKIKTYSEEVFSEFLGNKAGKEWLSTKEGKIWLIDNTKGGREWLNSEEGKMWLSTDQGKMFLSKVKGLEWIHSNEGQNWSKTENGKKWLNTKNSQYTHSSNKTQIAGGYSKKNKSYKKYKKNKQIKTNKKYKKNKTNKKK